MKTHMQRMQKVSLILLIWLLLAIVSSCAPAPTQVNETATPAPTLTVTPSPTFSGTPEAYSFTILKRWPHDTSAFTEGLTFKDGNLYESNGQNGQSDLRILDLDTGEVKNKVNLGEEYFGEGMTILNGKIFQLTWQNNKGFIYDEDSLALLGEFAYQGEGWGLTTDGHSLIMSNGSNAITFIDPETFLVQKVIYVYDNGAPLIRLNELEYIEGKIYANIWYGEKIVQIDPELGTVLGWIDLTGLRPASTEQNGEAVLNGIAYDAVNDRLFVTGKLWPEVYEIKLEK